MHSALILCAWRESRTQRKNVNRERQTDGKTHVVPTSIVLSSVPVFVGVAFVVRLASRVLGRRNKFYMQRLSHLPERAATALGQLSKLPLQPHSSRTIEAIALNIR